MRSQCPRCGEKRPNIKKAGYFYRSSDSQSIQRYQCKNCHKYFSSARFDPCIFQKKRRLNTPIERLITHGYSMREIARQLKISKTTVQRKMRFLALQARAWQHQFLKKQHIERMQFDDMETFEHSKCKPLSITIAVEDGTRLILGTAVASMPAKGLLSEKAKKKYGFRPDERKSKRRHLFQTLQPHVATEALISSDQNPHYESDVREFFPQAEYRCFKGRRGCVVGQGELKAGGYDPLFSLNHTCAMLRANMNRLFRRTWCTTKTVEGLLAHLALYTKAHNQRILQQMSAQAAA